jgi:hypothetical protein
MAYLEKFKDPRWQKRRLEILERDGFACRACGDGASTLHVHHVMYRQGRDPWEYPACMLLTLCELCHKPGTTETFEMVEELMASISPASKSPVAEATELFRFLSEDGAQLLTKLSRIPIVLRASVETSLLHSLEEVSAQLPRPVTPDA